MILFGHTNCVLHARAKASHVYIIAQDPHQLPTTSIQRMSLHLLKPALHTSSPACMQASSQLPMAAARIRHSATTHEAQRTHAQRQTAGAVAQNGCASIVRLLATQQRHQRRARTAAASAGLGSPARRELAGASKLRGKRLSLGSS